MMVPTLIHTGDRTRMYQLDLMLTNGRAPLILQLPLLVIWFISLFNLLSCDCLIAAASIQRLFLGIRTIICSAISVILVWLMSMSVFTDRRFEAFISTWQFVINAVAVFLGSIAFAQKGGPLACSNQN